MPHFGPIKRRELIACLQRAGFSSPFAERKHEFMLFQHCISDRTDYVWVR